MRRIMGIETEYGITVPSATITNHTLAATRIVNAFAGRSRPRSAEKWDYQLENPLRDARGFDVGPTQTDHTDEDLGLANLVLGNGGRLYVDHAHPEYSSPEVTGPLAAVRYDAAGEVVMQTAAELAVGAGLPPIVLYKNNTDNKGVSYGCHENYLMDRATPFRDIAHHLIPFFCSRQVITGAGRVGLGQDGRGHGFQLSQRADFFEAEVGLETTLKRPIINTRDEPHADPARYRRLHVIVGDANCAQVATFVKLGATTLVLDMIEAGFLPGDLELDQPVRAIKTISHDPTLTATVPTKDGRQLTGLDLQREYFELASKFVDDRYGRDADAETVAVLARWGSLLDRLAVDPLSTARELDWTAKLTILEGYRSRDRLDWDAPRLALVDLQYADLRPDKGLAKRLAASGRLETLVSPAQVEAAVDQPPADTRAFFRGSCMTRYGHQVQAASWDSVIFDLGGHNLHRIPTLDPYRGTRERVGALLEECHTAAELVGRLGE